MEVVKYTGFGKPKVVISPNVLKDIDFMHREYKSLEWSGVIFYSVEGDLSKPEELSFLVQGFYLMDLGTSGFTKFDFNTNMPDIYMENPEVLENGWTMGLMHSHHNMDTFFSGEDSRVLHVNADFFPQFLSLIVNCAGSYKAKVSTVIEGNVVEMFENIPNLPANVISQQKFIKVYDCEIVKMICCEERFKELAKAKPSFFRDSTSREGNDFQVSVRADSFRGGTREADWEDLETNSRKFRNAPYVQSEIGFNNGSEKFDEDFGVVETTQNGTPVDDIFDKKDEKISSNSAVKMWTESREKRRENRRKH